MAYAVLEKNNNSFRKFYRGPCLEEDPSLDEQDRAPSSCMPKSRDENKKGEIICWSVCCLGFFDEIVCSDANVHLSGSPPFGLYLIYQKRHAHLFYCSVHNPIMRQIKTSELISCNALNFCVIKSVDEMKIYDWKQMWRETLGLDKR